MMTTMKTDGSSTIIGSNEGFVLSDVQFSSPEYQHSHSPRQSDIGRLADWFRLYVDVRDRKYHSKTYKDCFIGSDVVDMLVYRRVVNTRQDAVRLGRYLQTELRLFSHVVAKNKHDFKDEYLFYKFNNTNDSDRNKYDKESRGALTMTSDVGLISDLEEKAKIFYQLADVHDRTYHHRFKKYRSVFVGNEIIDKMVYHGLARTRWDAIQLGRSMATHLDLFEHVDKKYTFADGNLFFRFSTGILKLIAKIEIDDLDRDRDDRDGTGPDKYVHTDNIALNSGHTAQMSGCSSSSSSSSSSSADDTPSGWSGAIYTPSFLGKTTTHATKRKHHFKYPDPLPPSLSEVFDDRILSGNIFSEVDDSYQKQQRMINILKNTYSNDLIDEWQVVLAELRYELKSLYTGHHEIIESSPLAGGSALRTNLPTNNHEVCTHPTTKKRLSTSSDSITTVNYASAKSYSKGMDLPKFFDAIDTIVQKNSTLLHDDSETSVWTEYIVEDEDGTDIAHRTTNGKILNEDEESYMEFTIIEDNGTVDVSYIDEIAML